MMVTAQTSKCGMKLAAVAPVSTLFVAPRMPTCPHVVGIHTTMANVTRHIRMAWWKWAPTACTATMANTRRPAARRIPTAPSYTDSAPGQNIRNVMMDHVAIPRLPPPPQAAAPPFAKVRAANLDGSIREVQEHKYCCDKKDDEQWEDCEWKTDIGLALAGHGVRNGYCLSGCPDDTVRVALDQWGGDCVGRGARAKCCKANFNTITKRAYTDEEEDLADLVQEFMDDQTCGSNSWYLKREVDFHLEHGNLTSLEMPMPLTRRSSLKSQEKMEDLLEAIAVRYGASVVKREIWDKYVVSKYENLTPANLRSWINDQITTITKSYSYLLESLICNMAYYNAVIGEKEVISCACETKDCCDSDDDYCSSDDGYDYTELSLSTRSLEKRAGPRPFDITFSDGRTMHYTSLGVCPLSFPVSLVSPQAPIH